MKHDTNIPYEEKPPTLGSLFAGIGGFDLGFEQAGWDTRWQVEINPNNRACLAARFPHAQRFEDVTQVGKDTLPEVDCITAGFPCQDISNAGSRRKTGVQGLKGKRSGLFFEVLRILEEIQPAWVVLENVAALLHSNDCQDIETVIHELAQRGYVGFFRVLNAQYFGIPQNRRRVFLVAGLGRMPTSDFLADAAPVEAIPMSFGAQREPRPEVSFAANTLSARSTSCQISLGAEVLVAEENGWREMVERERGARVSGLPQGLDGANIAECFAAGNAVPPPVARWIAQKLMESMALPEPYGLN